LVDAPERITSHLIELYSGSRFQSGVKNIIMANQRAKTRPDSHSQNNKKSKMRLNSSNALISRNKVERASNTFTPSINISRKGAKIKIEGVNMFKP